MENKHKNIDFQKIEEIVEGDADFRKQLLNAIIVAVEELKEKYIKGIEEKDPECIKQARHKIKPTLGLFDLHRLRTVLGQGKDIFSDNGFNKDYESHIQEITGAIKEIVREVNDKLKKCP